MKEKEFTQFFECLGEIWRDITAIEFLMRCAIAKKDKDIGLFPQPPYTQNRTYKDYPHSFSNFSFKIIVEKFNKRFPKISIPIEMVRLRNAMAHGIIAGINKNGIEHLVKFQENENEKELKVEFSLPLELKRLSMMRQSLKELRRYIMQVAKD